DPRMERAGLMIPGAARARLDRTRAPGGASAPASLPAPEPIAPPQVIVVEEPARLILVICDCPAGRLCAHDRQTIGAARQLADRGEGQGAVAVVVAAPDEPVGAAGADRMIAAGGALGDPEAGAPRLAELVRRLGPAHVLLPESAQGGDRAR